MYPLKFEPILKQTLWGATNYSIQAFECRLERSRESWEISGVENNESVVANGPIKV